MTETHVYENPQAAEEVATIQNPPPAALSLAGEDIAVKKGDVIAHYNHWVDIWHVKRIVKAGKPARSYNTGVFQPEINYVTHDAVPIEGKSGASRSHYEGNPGFGQTSTRQLARDGKFPWFLLDTTDLRTAVWIAEQDQLWVDFEDDQVADEERVAGTPEAFEARMAARARHARRMAGQAEQLAKDFRVMADKIENETRGRWIK